MNLAILVNLVILLVTVSVIFDIIELPAFLKIYHVNSAETGDSGESGDIVGSGESGSPVESGESEAET